MRIRYARLGALLAAGLAGLALAARVSAGDLPNHGVGWDALETKVDGLVEALIERQKLPGMTVAVTQKGRLVLAKGYGYANAKSKTPMKFVHRARIGSVTKALVTGPSAFQLMKAKNIDPTTKKLYGPNGVLGNDFEGHIDTGTRRYQPIVGLSIDAQDRAYAWYSNRTMSSGASNNLDQYQAPRPYTLPAGKTPGDIREMGIAKNGYVYTWYDDGRLSIGNPTDLDAVRGLSENGVRLPRGKSMLHIVGIDISKSEDHVYVWYDDSTVSSGTSTDFDAYFGPKRVVYGEGPGVTRYNVRGMGISKDDRVYTWFTHGKACSGTSDRLTAHLGFYNYSAAPVAGEDWKAWYAKITLQNLLDHRAGFTRDGDVSGGMTMFNRNESSVTYEQCHRYFLGSRKLLYEPGTSSSYSNHGFGLWTLMIERLSGKPYPRYVQENYLTPMGLQGRVTGEPAAPGQYDAWPHEMRGSSPWPLPFKEANLGLAAGGYLASARDLCFLMKNLDGKYTDAELDSMGWGKSGRKLHHNGLREGGTAYVVMFPNGFRAGNGSDLSQVHVALITNIATGTGELEELASAIALEVPKAEVSTGYDAWDRKPAQ